MGSVAACTRLAVAAGVTGACLLTTLAGAAAWAAVALDRCFTF